MKQIFITLILALAASAEGPKESLYARLGGRPAVTAVVDGLFTKMLADSRVNTWFRHVEGNAERAAAYKAKLHDFICQAAGGPCKYEGQDMFGAHKGRGVTDAAFGAVVEDLIAVLDDLKVGEKEKGQLLGLLGPVKAAVVEKGR
jgi:hemoglobin